MTRSTYRTLLPLSRYAKLLGISPVHFASAIAGDYWPDNGACEDIWWQYAWQTPEDFIARDELALAIYNAEQDIERVLGYSIAPRFVNEEFANYPQSYNRQYYSVGMHNVRGGAITVKTRLGKLIATGRRAVSALSAAAVVAYSDEDGDGWRETATLTFTDSTTDLRQVRVYTASKSADPSWEIRPLRSVTRSGSTVTVKLDSWLLINPLLWERHPRTNERPDPIDISGITNFVTTVDIYREYVDTTTTSAQLLWNPLGLNSEATQNGYASIHDADAGYIAPFAATYANGAWTTTCLDVSNNPDNVRLWYYAGALSDEYLAGYTTDPLSDYFATTVMWLATARLTKKLCSCGQAERVAAELQRDMTQITKNSTFVLNLQTDVFTNPFGTRVGEYRAWQRLSKLTDDYEVIGGVL